MKKLIFILMFLPLFLMGQVHVPGGGSGESVTHYEVGDNIGVGLNTLTLSNTTTAKNTALGYNALPNIGNYSQNVAIGYNAGASVTGADGNVFIGYEAYGTGSTSTNNNVIIGYQAGYSGGMNNSIAIGYLAGYEETGNNTINIGNEAGRYGYACSYNVYIGDGAGSGTGGTHNSSNYNIGIGTRALEDVGTAAINNTAVGVAALSDLSTTDNNVALGYYAGRTCIGTGNVFIGYYAGEDVGNVSNKLYIANTDDTTPLIYGEFDNDLVTINGNLGVTGTSPGTHWTGITCETSTADGEWVYINTSGEFDETDADLAATAEGTIGVRISATVVQYGGIYVTTGLTANSKYFLSLTEGEITVTEPTTPDISLFVGTSISTTQLVLSIERRGSIIP